MKRKYCVYTGKKEEKSFVGFAVRKWAGAEIKKTVCRGKKSSCKSCYFPNYILGAKNKEIDFLL